MRRIGMTLGVLSAVALAGCGGRCEERVETVSAVTVGAEVTAPLGAGPFSGIWDTSWSGGSGGTAVLALSHHGAYAAGWYFYPTDTAPGAVSAEVRGNVMEGRWTSPGGSGPFRFDLAPDGRSFRGTWSNLDGGGGGEWVGVRR